MLFYCTEMAQFSDVCTSISGGKYSSMLQQSPTGQKPCLSKFVRATGTSSQEAHSREPTSICPTIYECSSLQTSDRAVWVLNSWTSSSLHLICWFWPGSYISACTYEMSRGPIEMRHHRIEQQVSMFIVLNTRRGCACPKVYK
jgi:hypothetical protein